MNVKYVSSFDSDFLQFITRMSGVLQHLDPRLGQAALDFRQIDKWHDIPEVEIIILPK